MDEGGISVLFFLSVVPQIIISTQNCNCAPMHETYRWNGRIVEGRYDTGFAVDFNYLADPRDPALSDYWKPFPCTPPLGQSCDKDYFCICKYSKAFINTADSHTGRYPWHLQIPPAFAITAGICR